jgi:beta-galactosidase
MLSRARGRITLTWLGLACLAWALAPAICAADTQPLDAGWEYYQGSLGGLWEIWRGAAASDNVKWAAVTLPHCFNARDSVDPDRTYYQGPGWYRTKFKLANPYPDGRTLLRMEGAGQKTAVFVDLDQVGETHVGGYDEFRVDLTDAAAAAAKGKGAEGMVPLAVRCDNSRDLEMMPSDLSDFVLYGGLYRHVHLDYLPAVSLERVHIETNIGPDKPATAKVLARLYNPESLTDEVELVIEVRDPANRVVFTGKKKLSPWSGLAPLAEFTIDTPELWSPTNPRRYSCHVSLKSSHGEHAVDEHFGLRLYEFVEHGPFKLNGERLLLRGTHYHEDHAGVGAAVPDDAACKTFRMIKDLGANFVRLGHYPQSKLVLDQCDELGLLVWEEIPWCRGGLGGERYQQQGRDMIEAMIDQHYNRPSVILWGLGNEDDWPGAFPTLDQQAIRTYMSKLNGIAHKLDPSRLTTIRRCEFCKDIPDVYSPSIWAGWYSGRYSEYRASTEAAIKATPRFFHAEWGGDSHAHRHSEDPDAGLAEIATGEGTSERDLDYKLKGGPARVSSDGDWSESYICNLFDWHLKEQETMPQLTGSAQWVFKDFATPLRPENPVPRVNQKGLVERDLTPKEGYYVFQSYWAEKPMVHIYGHTWPVRWGKPDEKKMVKVYSNCPEVELFVNGESLGSRKRNSQNFPAAGLRWSTALKAGKNKVRAVGKGDGQDVVDEIEFDYQTKPWGKPATLAFEVVGRTADGLTLQATLQDENGATCLDARNIVRFGATGDAALVDNLGTSTGSRVVQLCNGVAQIHVTRAGGQAAASVSSAGIPTAILDLPAAGNATTSRP